MASNKSQCLLSSSSTFVEIKIDQDSDNVPQHTPPALVGFPMESESTAASHGPSGIKPELVDAAPVDIKVENNETKDEPSELSIEESLNIFDVKFEIDEEGPVHPTPDTEMATEQEKDVSKGLKNYEIEDLLNDSDIENLDPGQQDDGLYSDFEFEITSNRDDSSSSESELEAETTVSAQHGIPRGRNSGRGRIANSTGTQRQNIPASGGATNTDVTSTQKSGADKLKPAAGSTTNRKQCKSRRGSTIQAGQGLHQCEVCQRRFERRSQMMDHNGTHTFKFNESMSGQEDIILVPAFKGKKSLGSDTIEERTPKGRAKMTKNKKYSNEDLAKALEDIKNGVMTVYRASKMYNIPNQTLHDKINKKYKKRESPGAPTVLSPTEEALLVKWVLQMAEIGFPVTKDQLLHSVAKLLIELKRPNPFRDGVPGRHWYEAFLKRNPIISKRVSQALTTEGNATEGSIKGWFERVRKYFKDKNLLDVLEDPSRVFNCDESAFFLCPKGQPGVARKGVKIDKEYLTLSLGASADGKLMPILALLPYKRIPQNISLKYPKDWTIGRTDSGWMTSEAFYEYVANKFEPFLTKENIRRPVALFLDGHFSHLSLPLCKFCKEKDIILIALLPATHALQPMDAVFHSLKNAWSEEVHTWSMNNNDSRLKREDFGSVLEKAIEKTLRPEIIQNAFRKSGLYPFDENAVDYEKLPKSSTVAVTSSGTSTPTSLNSLGSSNSLDSMSVQSKDFIKWFEMNLDAHKLIQFRECSGEWTGNVKDDSLYYFWKQLTQSSYEPNPDLLSLGNATLVLNNCTLTDLDRK